MKNMKILLGGDFVRESGNRVKGFLSFNSEDNDFDILSPEGFDLDTFMTKRTALYNHKLWLDAEGNAIPIGEVEDIALAKLVNHEDPTVWGIKNTKTGEVIDTFPKDRLPSAVLGDRGLWCVTRVDIPEVWSKVVRQVLNGFSWAGKTVMRKIKIGNILKDVGVKSIMNEVSLVFTPQHPNSTLVPILKGAATETIENLRSKKDDYGVHGFVFSPTLFTEASARKWLEELGFDASVASKLEDGEIVFMQTGEGLFENSLKTIGVSQGVQAILGILAESSLEDDEKSEVLRLTERLLGSNVISNMEDEMATKKTKKSGETGDTALPASDEHVAAKTEATPAPSAEVLAEAQADADVVLEEVKVDKTEEVKPAEEVAAETITEPTLQDAVVDETIVAKESSEEEGALISNEPPAVELTAKEKAEKEDSILSKTMEDKMSAITSTITEAISENVKTMVVNLSDTLTKFTDAASKLSEMLAAQSEAVSDLLNPDPALATAKSAVGETVDSTELETLKKELEEVKESLTSMSKTATPSPVREEPSVLEKTKSEVPNECFGEFWPFRA